MYWFSFFFFFRIQFITGNQTLLHFCSTWPTNCWPPKSQMLNTGISLEMKHHFNYFQKGTEVQMPLGSNAFRIKKGKKSAPRNINCVNKWWSYCFDNGSASNHQGTLFVWLINTAWSSIRRLSRSHKRSYSLPPSKSLQKHSANYIWIISSLA